MMAETNGTGDALFEPEMGQGDSHNELNFSSILMKLEEDNAVLEVLKANMNGMFLAVMGSIIIFMQAGFGFLEAGSIRAKNTTNILIKNFADLTFGNRIYILDTYTNKMI